MEKIKSCPLIFLSNIFFHALYLQCSIHISMWHQNLSTRTAEFATCAKYGPGPNERPTTIQRLCLALQRTEQPATGPTETAQQAVQTVDDTGVQQEKFRGRFHKAPRQAAREICEQDRRQSTGSGQSLVQAVPSGRTVEQIILILPPLLNFWNSLDRTRFFIWFRFCSKHHFFHFWISICVSLSCCSKKL